MDAFYERSREENTAVHLSRSSKHIYPAHYHQNLEVYLLRSGSYTVEVSGERISLTSGSLLFIDSYEVHEYLGGTPGADDCTVVIPYRYLERFNMQRGGRAVAERKICDSAAVERLLRILDDYVISAASEPVRDAGIELFLAELFTHLKLGHGGERGDSALIRGILQFIQDNYRTHISRSKIATALGYTEAHISRVFHKYMNRGISEYIAALRLQYVNQHKSKGDRRSLTELVYDAGFGSIESYYRVKRRSSADPHK